MIFSIYDAPSNLLLVEKTYCQNSGHLVFTQDMLSTELDLYWPDGMAVSGGHMTTSSLGQVI